MVWQYGSNILVHSVVAVSSGRKYSSWRDFCSNLNSKTQTEKVWKAIRKIKGKGGSNSVNHLKANCKLITNKKEVLEALAMNLSKDPQQITILPNVKGLKC